MPFSQRLIVEPMKISQISDRNAVQMPSAGRDYYVDSLSTQNGGASHRGREPRLSGFVIRTAETGVGGVLRA